MAAAWQEAYRAECPPFDPEFSETDRQMGRVPERIRTWPGAKVSGSHFRRMAAIGAAAGWLTEDQPWHHGFGPGSPLAKLVGADGQVLLLGAPLDRLTILHHAESLVDSPEKRMASHVIPVRERGEVVWRMVSDHDTSTAIGAFPYQRAVGDQDPFAVIGQLALDAGCGVSGLVGKAEVTVPGRTAGAIRHRMADQRIRVLTPGRRCLRPLRSARARALVVHAAVKSPLSQGTGPAHRGDLPEIASAATIIHHRSMDDVLPTARRGALGRRERG